MVGALHLILSLRCHHCRILRLIVQICSMITVKRNTAKFTTNLALRLATPGWIIELRLPFLLVPRVLWFSKKIWLGSELLELGISWNGYM